MSHDVGLGGGLGATKVGDVWSRQLWQTWGGVVVGDGVDGRHGGGVLPHQVGL